MTMIKGDSVSHALCQVPATLELLGEEDAVAKSSEAGTGGENPML